MYGAKMSFMYGVLAKNRCTFGLVNIAGEQQFYKPTFQIRGNFKNSVKYGVHYKFPLRILSFFLTRIPRRQGHEW